MGLSRRGFFVPLRDTLTGKGPEMADIEKDPIAVDTMTAAGLLHRAPHTLAQWRSEGIGPAYVRTGRKHSRVLYRISDLEKYLADNLVETNTRGYRFPKGDV